MIKSVKYIFIIFSLIASFIFSRDRLTGDGVIIKQEPYTIEEINKLEELYNAGNIQALETLINIYQDHNQIYDIRIASLNILSSIKNPMVVDALQQTIKNIDFIELEFLQKSMQVLINNQENESSQYLIEALANSENKIMDLRANIIDAIGQNGTDDAIITLVDLYEISMTNHMRMNELMSLTLGNIDDDRGIPILIKIASDKSVDLRIRNKAVEILAKKDSPELVDYFVQMLGDPNTNEEMLTFVHNTMGEIHKDRLTLALLESFETGKSRYFSNLYSIMNSLENYTNPQIKPAFLEVAKADEFPRLLRIKAIQSLGNFDDPTVLNELIPILEQPENYEFYFEILQLAQNLNADNKYMNLIRKTGHQLMMNKTK